MGTISWNCMQPIPRTNFQGWSRSRYRGIQTTQLFLSVTTWMVSGSYSLSWVYLRLDANVRWDWQSGSNSVAENGSGWKTRGQLAQRHPCGASSQILQPRSKDTRNQWFSTPFSFDLELNNVNTLLWNSHNFEGNFSEIEEGWRRQSSLIEKP